MATLFNFILPLIFIMVLGTEFLGRSWAIFFSIIYIIISLIANVVRMYNQLKSEHLKIYEGRSNIDVYLNQRFDEISAMYKIVKEYKLHEVETLRELVELRQFGMTNDMNFKEKTDLHNQIERRIPEVFTTFENYPELNSNENFLRLQEAIQNNEDNLSSTRKIYNSYVNQFNTTIAVFPTLIIAKMFNFKEEELYETPISQRENPLL